MTQIGEERRVMLCKYLTGSGITIEPDDSEDYSVLYVKCPQVPLSNNFLDAITAAFEGSNYDEQAKKVQQWFDVKGILKAPNVNRTRKLLMESYLQTTQLYGIVKKPDGAGGFENVNFYDDTGTEVWYLKGRVDKLFKINLIEAETYEVSFRFLGWITNN